MDRDAQIHTQHKTMRIMKVSTHTGEMRLQHIRVFAVTLRAYRFNDTENSSCCVCLALFFLYSFGFTIKST